MLIAEFEENLRENRLWLYNPDRTLNPTEKQREFHRAGAIPGVRFRALGAGNQQGKTLCGGMEVAMHVTGLYPDWWDGKRIDGPNDWWVASVTDESTRNNPQRILLGENRQWGTGTIPASHIIGKPTMARGGIPDLVDSVQVRHVSGGMSTIYFKSYKEGREKWQGATLTGGIWYDEEPDWDIWSEGKARLMRYSSMAILTFTPLLGMTEVCSLFYEMDENPDRDQYRLTNMNIEDATFYTEAEKAQHIKEWPEHEKRARLMGLPILGAGLVYPIPNEMFVIDPVEIPRHFRRIIGLDVGVAHPTAAVWIAYNPDTDVVYVYDEYKREDPYVRNHAMTLVAKGADRIPVAWPHDALKSNPKSGENFAELYRKDKVKVLPESARYDDDKGGPQTPERAIADIIDRMRTDRFKVFGTLREWLREKGSWHRKKKPGQGVAVPVPYMDDLMKATLYAMMMLRHARPDVETMRQAFAQADYDPLSSNWSNPQ